MTPPIPLSPPIVLSPGSTPARREIRCVDFSQLPLVFAYLFNSSASDKRSSHSVRKHSKPDWSSDHKAASAERPARRSMPATSIAAKCNLQKTWSSHRNSQRLWSGSYSSTQKSAACGVRHRHVIQGRQLLGCLDRHLFRPVVLRGTELLHAAGDPPQSTDGAAAASQLA